MKILFTIADMLGCGFYRAMQPAVALDRVGIKTMVMDYLDEKYIMDVDAIVLQRTHVEEVYNAVKSFKETFKKKIVYEIDDWLHGVTPDNPAYNIYNPFNPIALSGITKLMGFADATLVTTEPLKEKYIKWNKNIFVLPNFVDLTMFGQQPAREDGLIKIGWAGGSSHRADLEEALPALKLMVEKYKNVRIVMFGWFSLDTIYSIPFDKIINIEGVGVFQYPRKLSSLNLDIGIAPLKDTTFNACKSNVKFLEYSACGIPTIASDVIPYRDIKHGQTGFLAHRHKDWVSALEHLINDAELRRETGRKAREFVKNNYSMEAVTPKYVNAFTKIVGGKI